MSVRAEVPLVRPPLRPPPLLTSSLIVVRRNLIHIKRMPELLLDVTIQPVMFVVMFAFVFGGSITPPGANYREWLIPGIMGQTMAFASFIVAIGLVNDLQKGIVDRLRSLPISRQSILLGRSISSLIHSSIGITVMAVTGLAIGWRAHGTLLDTVLGFVMMLVWGFAMIWLGIWVGSAMRSVESVNGVMFTAMFPITFVSNAFAPTQFMPGWLALIAEWNPFSSLVQATRELWGNAPPAGGDAAWPLQHPVLMTVVWSLVLTAIFAPLAVRSFQNRSRD